MTRRSPSFYSRQDVTALAAALLLGTLGAAVLLILPGLLVALEAQYRFTDLQLGYFSFSDLGGLTLGTAFGAKVHLSLNTKRSALLGLIIAAVANAASSQAISFWYLLAFRMVAGMGAGLLVAVCYTVLARSAHVDRNFSIYVLGQGLFSAVALKAMPALAHIMGAAGIFRLLAITYVLALGVVRYLPVVLVSTGSTRPQTRNIRWDFAVWCGLAAVLAFFIAQGALWAHLELIGMRGGVEPVAVASALALSALVGLSGPLTAAIVGPRLGRLAPLLAGASLELAAVTLMRAPLNPTRFAIAASLFNIAWNFTIPYQLSALSMADPRGAVVTWAASATLAGLAAGPFLAALVVDSYGAVGLLWMCAILVLASLVGFLPVLLRPAPRASVIGSDVSRGHG